MKAISLYRLNALLLLLILTAVVLYYGRSFLIPLFFSFLFVMLLLPVCKKLESWGLGRVWSTLAGVLIIIIFLAAFVAIIAGQGAALVEDLPQIQEKANKLLTDTAHWIQVKYGIAPKEQMEQVQKAMKSVSEAGGTFASGFFAALTSFLSGFVLVLLYFFFIMWKREKYLEFLLKFVKEENKFTFGREILEIRKVAGQYVIGRLVSMGFLAVIYIIGFSIVGLPNAILLALVAVIPTIVPYVGAFIGGFFPVIMALLTGSADMVLPVVIILVIAQVIDNNIIEPLVEGNALDISPIFTIISIVIGQMVWGVAGMILFMPLFAIIKIVCDHIPSLHPYSFLLENEVEEPKWIQAIKKMVKK